MVRNAGRPPLWRDVRVLRVFAQIVFVLALVALGAYLSRNLRGNLRAQGIRTDFGFLSQPAGFRIADSSFQASQSVRSAILVGMRNTGVVAGTGVALATVLGVTIGAARLSRNWLVRRGAALYVESIRNVPPLIIILFFWLAVILTLPPIGDAFELFGIAVFSNSGLVIPSLALKPDASSFWPIVAGAAATAALVWMLRTRTFDRTGEPHHRVLWGGGVFVAVVATGYLILGRPIVASVPVRGEFGTTGGLRLNPEFAALLFGLVLYTATHIAEIVRGSLLAVHRGQSEAATALGLSEFQRLRHVVLPQALRIAVPPMTNQYLNLTKNSSLAVAIGYPEVTGIVVVLVTNGSPAPQSFATLMLVYLVFSLGISAIANLVNRRLVTRGAR